MRKLWLTVSLTKTTSKGWYMSSETGEMTRNSADRYIYIVIYSPVIIEIPFFVLQIIHICSSSQMINGVNPLKIVRLDELPRNFPVTDRMVSGHMDDGETLESAIAVIHTANHKL